MRKSIRKSFGKWGLLPLLAGVPILLVGLSTPANANNWQVGDVFAGIPGGQYNVFDNNGNFLETISDGLGGFTTGCAFNNDQSLLYTTNFSNTKVPVYDVNHPHLLVKIIDTNAQSPGGSSESIAFYADGSFTVGHPDGNDALQQYDNTDAFVTSFFPVVDGRGVDWHDPAADQTTVFYTSESRTVRRFDIGGNVQLADFAVLPAAGSAFALRLLPPGDGTGGLLVADLGNIKRLDGAGAVSQSYDVAGEDSWFAMNLDPNGTSFWAGNFSTGQFYRFNIASGAIEVGPIASGGNLFGLCVLGEPTAGVPEDGEDGFVVKTDLKPESNPNCFARKSGGVTSVAFFSNEDFDAPGEIDQASIIFADADVVRCAIEDAFMEGPTGVFSQDGFDDLVCKFKKKEMSLPAAGEDCAELLAEGFLVDGTAWTGSDLYCLAGEAACNAGVPISLDD